MSKRKIQKKAGFTLLNSNIKESDNIIYNWFQKRLKQGRSQYLTGFTLIELLVVIAIIGILSGVVLVSMGGARNRANDGRRISDIKNIQLALEIYYDVHSTYPLDNGSEATLYTVPKPLDSFLKISKDPTAPAESNNYFYWSTGQDYHLGAVLQEYNKIILEDDDATTGFDGGTTDCAGTAATGDDERCYDVTP